MSWPAPPSAHGVLALVATAGALILFTRDRVPLATSALAVLVSLAVAFTLFPFTTPEGRLAPHDLFAGFGTRRWISPAARRSRSAVGTAD